jgi:hypothetical protein
MSTCKAVEWRAACALLMSMLGGIVGAQPVTEKWWGPAPVGATWETAQKNTGSFGSDRHIKSTRLPNATWKGGTAIATAGPSGTLLTTMDEGRWIAFLAPDGTPAMTFDPPIGWAYPLAVGKSFDMSYKATDANGAVSDIPGACTVESWEKVEVRAGSFDAYRIACKNSWGENGIYWSSPGTGALIKTRLQRAASHPSGAGTQESELVVRPSVLNPLVGTWRLVSFEGEIQGTTDKLYSMGRAPVGYLSFMPDGRMAVVITAEGRKAGASDQERAALYSSVIAYAGRFRVEGDKWVTSVEASANPAWVGTEQPRSFKVDGNTLQEETPWFPRPDKPAVKFLNTYERVK